MTETVHEMLDRLERELSARIASLRQQLDPLVLELDSVRVAKRAIAQTMAAPSREASTEPLGTRESASMPSDDVVASYRSLTMKQLAIEALAEHFQNGATANDLREFFVSAWGRSDISRQSFSPQLSRLRAENKVRYDGKLWHLMRDDAASPAPDANEPPTPREEGGSVTDGAPTPSIDSPKARESFWD